MSRCRHSRQPEPGPPGRWLDGGVQNSVGGEGEEQGFRAGGVPQVVQVDGQGQACRGSGGTPALIVLPYLVPALRATEVWCRNRVPATGKTVRSESKCAERKPMTHTSEQLTKRELIKQYLLLLLKELKASERDRQEMKQKRVNEGAKETD